MPPKKAPATKTAAKPAAKTGVKSTGAPKGAAGGAKGAPGGAKAKAAEAPPKAPPLPEVTLEQKQIVAYFTEEKEEEMIKKSQRWPYIVDSSGVVARFLQYRDINLLEVTSSEQMEPERIRMALLGSLKYGKPLVIDMGDLDMFAAITEFLNRILPDLTDLVMTKKVVEEKCIDQLVKPTDDQDYKNSMLYNRTEFFRFGIITSKEDVSDEVKSKMLVVRVK